MRTRLDNTTYAWTSRVLHWLMAVAVLTMLFVGVGMVASLSNYHWLLSIHRPLGSPSCLGHDPLHQSPAEAAAAIPGHHARSRTLHRHVSERLLYALMFALPLVGWGMLSAARYPIALSDSNPVATDSAAQHSALHRASQSAHGAGLSLVRHVPGSHHGSLAPTPWCYAMVCSSGCCLWAPAVAASSFRRPRYPRRRDAGRRLGCALIVAWAASLGGDVFGSSGPQSAPRSASRSPLGGARLTDCPRLGLAPRRSLCWDRAQFRPVRDTCCSGLDRLNC